MMPAPHLPPLLQPPPPHPPPFLPHTPPIPPPNPPPTPLLPPFHLPPLQPPPPPTPLPPAQPADHMPAACAICGAPTIHAPEHSLLPICAVCRRANNLSAPPPHDPTPHSRPHPQPPPAQTTHRAPPPATPRPPTAPPPDESSPARPTTTPTPQPPPDLPPIHLHHPPEGGVPDPFHFAQHSPPADTNPPPPRDPTNPSTPQQRPAHLPTSQPPPTQATTPDPLAELRAQLLARFPDRPPLPPTNELPLLSHLDPSTNTDGRPLASHPKLYVVPAPLNLSSPVAFPRLRKPQDGGASAARYGALAQGPHNGWGMATQELTTPTGPVSALTQALARTLMACSRAPHLADALCPICLTRHLPLPCPIMPTDTAATIERARAFCTTHYGAQSNCVACGTFHAPHPCPAADPK